MSVAAVVRIDFPWHKELAMSCAEGDFYRWRPGIRWVDGYPDREAVADGVGVMLLVEIGRYTPPAYSVRVFYIRQFALPSGQLVGRPKLRVMGAAGFTRLCKGYRYSYEVTDEMASVKMEEDLPTDPTLDELADAVSY